MPLNSSHFSLKIFETRRAVPGGPLRASLRASSSATFLKIFWRMIFPQEMSRFSLIFMIFHGFSPIFLLPRPTSTFRCRRL